MYHHISVYNKPESTSLSNEARYSNQIMTNPITMSRTYKRLTIYYR